MAKTQAVHDQCPIEVGLNILSGKWKLKILWHLSKGTIRFNELQRLMFSAMFSASLRGFEPPTYRLGVEPFASRQLPLSVI